MLTLLIYLAIGIAAALLLFFLFKKAGDKEMATSPRLRWEKAIEEYGDPAIMNLYQNAQSDAERAEIAAFVNNELAKINPKLNQDMSQEIPQETEGGDTMGITTILPNISREEETAAIIEEIPIPEDRPAKDEQALGELMSSPAYNFWQEPALTNETAEEAADINKKLQDLMNEPEPAPAPPEMPAFAPDMFGDTQAAQKPIMQGSAIEEPALSEPEPEPLPQIRPAMFAPDNTAAANAIDDNDELQEEHPKKKRSFFGRRNKETAVQEIPQQENDSPNAGAIFGTAAAAGIAAEATINNTQTVADTETVGNAVYEKNLCPECGSPVEDGYAFCIICGATINNATTATAEPVSSESVVSEPVVSEPVVNEPVVSEPVVQEAAEEDPVAAYRASTANAYAAAAAKGLWHGSDRAKNAIFERSAEQYSASAQKEKETVNEISKPTSEPTSEPIPEKTMVPISSSTEDKVSPHTMILESIDLEPMSAEPAPVQPEIPVQAEDAGPSLEEILANVKALEDRIFAENNDLDKE